ncbi:alpha/beta hydrolase family protein [Flavobacterium fluviatile]|uniref:alpha/beta hydrolase family protein n=1 Tax=Flavobacterium fluviatile TaxID=1862387 RepID=UPI0013D4C6D7|nr:prolyl oligopeptidase family serine peptidase [Flavobacterium fluviatile]
MSNYDIEKYIALIGFKILRLFAMLVLLFILPLVACPLWGQVVQKKQLTQADYKLWGELRIDKVSPDENWVSYKITYDNGIDTLFVRHVSTNKTYSYPNGNFSTFTKNNGFVCLTKTGLYIRNLKTGQSESIDWVSQYSYSETNDLLLIHNSLKQLLLKTPLSKTVKEIQNVESFSLSPDGGQLVCSTIINKKHNLLLIDLHNLKNEHYLVSDSENRFSNFTWQKEGKSLACFSISENASHNSLYYYVFENKQLYHLDPAEQPGFPTKTNIVSHSFYKLVISYDLQRIFFGIRKQSDPLQQKEKPAVEVWNANDKWIYPQQYRNGDPEKSTRIALWKPLVGICVPLTTPDLPKIILSGKQQYALLSNPKAYEPQYEQEGLRDYYLVNLETLEKKLFLKAHYPHPFSIVPSPQGKYIAYFKEDNWWVYNFSKDSHTNVTQAIGGKFTAKEESLAPDALCGNPGWSKEESEILLYDQYDLWAVAPDGSSHRRLTRGKESKIKYRIAPRPNISPLDFMYEGKVIPYFDLNKGFYLTAEGDDGKTGFFKWTSATGAKKVIYQDSYIDQLYYDTQQRNLFCREQRFDLSPQVLFMKKGSVTKVIVQSNTQQKKYYWGRSELIRYENSKKQNLKGVLYYPANYDPTKKYPMIVSIYEILSKELHYYTNPGYINGIGFNITDYTTQGYFVLLPDIMHEKQNVGPSTVDCVISSTEKVISLGLIDPNKIGLTGHSFGGYETSFIITQTPLFATAVAGGGITDLKSFYLTVNQNNGKPDMWRFQTQQWRMGKTPFEAPLLYQQSSPIDHVQNVTTPLLLWSGKQDEQVDSHQSIEYYLALRRLNKKNIMLLYPNQGHVISDPLQHADLTNRIKQWFDYYLKDNHSAEWVRDGTN